MPRILGLLALRSIGVSCCARASRGWPGHRGFSVVFAFGYLCSQVLGHFGPRQLAAFSPIYFMLFYMLAGLWFGRAFIVIGLGITVLTLIGCFFIPGGAFLLWLAAVNGGGLILSGL
jgi:hypothetical protein